MNQEKEINAKILKLLDELLVHKKNNQTIDDTLKNKIDSLSNKELVELIQIYSDISKYEGSKEKKEIPEFLLYRMRDYFSKEKAKIQKESLPSIVIQLVQNTINIIQHNLNLNLQVVPIQSYRGNQETKGNKVVLQDYHQEKKVEFSLIPQEETILLSIFIQNITGSLTLKLHKDNYIIDIKHFSNLKNIERINIEDLKKGEYIIDLSGAYNNKFYLKIQG